MQLIVTRWRLREISSATVAAHQKLSAASAYTLAKEVVRGWLCMKCLREWEDEEMRTGHGITMFGYEGFLDDGETTIWDEP